MARFLSFHGHGPEVTPGHGQPLFSFCPVLSKVQFSLQQVLVLSHFPLPLRREKVSLLIGAERERREKVRVRAQVRGSRELHERIVKGFQFQNQPTQRSITPYTSHLKFLKRREQCSPINQTQRGGFQFTFTSFKIIPRNGLFSHTSTSNFFQVHKEGA